jgi:hypothetical protein
MVGDRLDKVMVAQLAWLRRQASKPRVSYRMVVDARLVLFLLDAYKASRGKVPGLAKGRAR